MRLALGAPPFFSAGDAVGVSVGDGVGVGEGVSVGSGVDDFFLCFDFGVVDGDCSSSGGGDDFFFFRMEGVGDSSSAGVSDGFFFFADGLGEGVGDSFATVFFFRCGDGVGVGVEKKSLIFSPRVCALTGAAVAKTIDAIRKMRSSNTDLLTRLRPRFPSAPLC